MKRSIGLTYISKAHSNKQLISKQKLFCRIGEFCSVVLKGLASGLHISYESSKELRKNWEIEMGKRKKKGYSDDVIDDDISTDDENREKLTQNQDLLPNCPHVGKAVHISFLKKALKAAWLRIGACGACAKEKRNVNAKSQGKIVKPTPGEVTSYSKPIFIPDSNF